MRFRDQYNTHSFLLIFIRIEIDFEIFLYVLNDFLSPEDAKKEIDW